MHFKKSKLGVFSRITALLLTVAMVSIQPVSTEAGFWNLSGSLWAHDPTMAIDGSTWWVPATGQGIQMKWSTNGTQWNDGIQIFGSQLSWWKTYAPAMTTNDCWAPDLKYYRSRYYLFYSVSEFGKNNSAIGLVSCSSINKGDWRDDGLIISSKSGSTAYNAIDPNLVEDKDGKPWLVFGSWFSGIQIVRLDQSTMKTTGSITTIAYKSGGIEGPSIIYKDNYYYLFVSLGECCKGLNSTYKIAVGRSSNVTGPYVDKNGTDMKNGGGTIFDSGNAKWIGPGGQFVFRRSSSSFLLVRHAYDGEKNGDITLLISDLYWSGGWPTY